MPDYSSHLFSCSEPVHVHVYRVIFTFQRPYSSLSTKPAGNFHVDNVICIVFVTVASVHDNGAVPPFVKSEDKDTLL